jgi:Ni,Fe-hydrogenase III small subunit/NAD-dependent dihydropyrimidine dehydrogenase PreA subunit
VIRLLRARVLQGHRTTLFPDGPPPELPARFRGRPEIDGGLCRSGCSACAEACPTQAIRGGESVQIDLGRCLFCSDCVEACPEGAISFTDDYRLAVRRREDLVVRGNQDALPLAAEMGAELRRLLGRSLKLRQVSAGGCNGCELDTNVLNTVGWDLGRFGVQFVASPRHADGLLITGAVSHNMKLALQKTYDAIPAPKIVIAVGACAIGGGPFAGHAEVNDGATDLLPIDLLIPGCPPHPLTILDGILRLLGRVDGGKPR